MRYLLLLYGPPFRPEDVGQDAFEAHMSFSRELHDAGAYVDSAPLAPAEAAKTVRIRDGERLVVDGPFADTKEILGGYYLIEAESLDAAVEWAQRLRSNVDGSIEIRPLLSLST
jgi:hypothetical protein